MSTESPNVTLEVTDDGNLDLSVPTEDDTRTLSPVELLLVGFFLRASNDVKFVEDLIEWTSDHYEEYFLGKDEQDSE